MKRMVLFVLAVLLLSFTQCKKAGTPTTDEGVLITLTANYGHDGEKTGFVPSSGAFVWTEGATEYIYVGGSNHGGCMGTLSGTGTGTGTMTFSGSLDYSPAEGETLHFFYLGKGDIKVDDARSYPDFSNQDGSLSNLTDHHIAIGHGSFSSGTINYATTLEMKMAIAHFDLSEFVDANSVPETVYLYGDDVYSSITVDFCGGVVSGRSKGYINVGTASSDMYVAMVPSTESQTTLGFASASKTGSITFLRGIQEGKYYTASDHALNVTANSMQQGEFSISATEKVYFSPGNLQYIQSSGSPYWKFADYQYEYFGTSTGQNSDATNVDRDLFGAGTWCSSGNPNNVSTNTEDYSWDVEFTGTINGHSDWFILSQEQWSYILNESSRGNYRFLLAKIRVGNNEQTGVILFPDNYDASIGDYTDHGAFTFYNSTSGRTGVTVSAGDWVRMQNAGAIFLPAAGYRNGTTVGNIGAEGNYWTSTYDQNSYKNGKIIYMGTSFFQSDYQTSFRFGCSIRLVRKVN